MMLKELVTALVVGGRISRVQLVGKLDSAVEVLSGKLSPRPMRSRGYQYCCSIVLFFPNLAFRNNHDASLLIAQDAALSKSGTLTHNM
jgi:hypothetical protein